MDLYEGAQPRDGMLLFHSIPTPAEAPWMPSSLLPPLIAFVATHCGECAFAINLLPVIN